MLTGKTIDVRKAKSLGLVDAVTQECDVRNAVKDAVFGHLKACPPRRSARSSTSHRCAAARPRGRELRRRKAGPA